MDMNTQQDNESIGVCIVTNDNYAETKFFIDNLIEKTDYQCKLYIYDYKSKCKAFKNYLLSVALRFAGKISFITKESKLVSIYNTFIQSATEKYLAILPINAILNANWASELIYHYKSIPNSGCIGIRSQFDDVALGSTLFVSEDEDEMKTIWLKRFMVLDLPIFFKKSIVEKTGLIEEGLNNLGYEINHFSFKFTSIGLINYYAKNTSVIKVFNENPFLFPHKNKCGGIEFNNEINEIAKRQNQLV